MTETMPGGDPNGGAVAGRRRHVVFGQFMAGGILLIIGTLALAWALLPAPRLLPGARLELSSSVMDLGRVREAAVASGAVVLRNAGDRPVVIESVEAA